MTTTTFDVQSFGAVPDGMTDSTAAIQKAIDAAANMLQAGGSPGPILFSAGASPYKVDTLNFPGVTQGWLSSLFDNGLYANRINVGSNNSFIGRGSNSQGLTGPSTWGPKSSWIQWKTPTHTDAFVDLAGVSGTYFEGLDIFRQTTTGPTVHMHEDTTTGAGCVNTMFNRCSIGGSTPALFVAPLTGDQSKVVGFNLKIYDCSISCPGAMLGTGVALIIENFGFVTVRGGYLDGVIISWGNIPLMDGFRFEDILSENLTNQSWLTVLNGACNVILDSIRIADSNGAYLFKNAGTGTWVTIRNCCFNDSVLIDPASTPNGLQAVIESLGARATYQAAKACFQWAQLTSNAGPTIYVSSHTFNQYVGQPMVINP